jgi:hypothetical protein
MTKKYDSYAFHTGTNTQEYTVLEARLMATLIQFGDSIDPHGWADGDFESAVIEIQKAFDVLSTELRGY